MMDPDSRLQRLSAIVRSTFNVPADVPITSETSSADVDGWDSLSYSLLIMNVEEAFGVTFDFEQLFALNNLGELNDLIGQSA